MGPLSASVDASGVMQLTEARASRQRVWHGGLYEIVVHNCIVYLIPYYIILLCIIARRSHV